MKHQVATFPRSFLSLSLATIAIACLPVSGFAAKETLAGWKHSGVMAVLTTPDGANLPAGAVVEQFPLLVRLHRDGFDFSQAKPDGSDVRFTTDDGKPLAHQIDEWDAAGGTASLWVRLPVIKGNELLTLRMHWGNPTANNTTDGSAVFNASNGHLGVWHMGATISDDAGKLESKDNGTKLTAGVIGGARQFSNGAGIYCGDKIAGYPVGNAPHTTELWFRSKRSNVSLIGWGVQKQQGKVVVQFAGPPHVRTDCWFSDGNVKSDGPVAMNEWNHVAFCYESGNARIYINGELAGKGEARGTPLKVQSPAMLSIGGWAGEYDCDGDIDEVRVSNVTRSAEWVKLQYENQKPMQTLVGPLVRHGGSFTVSPERATVTEGGGAKFAVQPAGALKLSWSLVRDGREEMLAVDRYALDFKPPRVSTDTTMGLRLKAVFRDGAKTLDIPVLVKETVPDPEFTLQSPAAWDGRSEIEVVPHVTNLAALQKADAGDLRMEWSAGPFAVIKESVPGKLRLLGAQKSGALTVTATIHNGGNPISKSVAIQVTEPEKDPWIERVPERDEKPEEGQFYARNDQNEGTLHYNGTLKEHADEVLLKVFADEKPYASQTAKPRADMSYAMTVKLKAGLVKYSVIFSTRSGGKETVLDKVGNLVCGDAFLIEGQSNAQSLAIDPPHDLPNETREWVRTYGGPQGFADGVGWARDYANKPPQDGKRPSLWNLAVWKGKPPEHMTSIGWWGMELAKQLVETQQVPVCIINGAVGGTRIDQHQRNPENPADLTTIYGKWLWRLQQARLTHGIRAVMWHQGENDQPAATPSGDYGWKNYQNHFIEMAAGWRRDMPNARHYFMFQITPNSCGMGGSDGAGDRLREKQRTLPDLFSNLSIMSTVGIRPPGGCHYPAAGYSEFARLLRPLIERDVFGRKSNAAIAPPNLLKASFAGAARDTIALEFDQPVIWRDELADQFHLDGEAGKVAYGSVSGSTLTLKLGEPTTAKHITYLRENRWSQDKLLIGANGIAALTFCEVNLTTP
jgi:hypothetical protein